VCPSSISAFEQAGYILITGDGARGQDQTEKNPGKKCFVGISHDLFARKVQVESTRYFVGFAIGIEGD
jgi:hypothetical protein